MCLINSNSRKTQPPTIIFKRTSSATNSTKIIATSIAGVKRVENLSRRASFDIIRQENDVYNASLTIKGAVLGDTGIYQCTFIADQTLAGGDASLEVKLVMKPTFEIFPITQHDNQNLEIETVVGHNENKTYFKLAVCRAIGAIPEPKIEWSLETDRKTGFISKVNKVKQPFDSVTVESHLWLENVHALEQPAEAITAVCAITQKTTGFKEGVGQNPTFEKKLSRLFTASKNRVS